MEARRAMYAEPDDELMPFAKMLCGLLHDAVRAREPAGLWGGRGCHHYREGRAYSDICKRCWATFTWQVGKVGTPYEQSLGAQRFRVFSGLARRDASTLYWDLAVQVRGLHRKQKSFVLADDDFLVLRLGGQQAVVQQAAAWVAAVVRYYEL